MKTTTSTIYRAAWLAAVLLGACAGPAFAQTAGRVQLKDDGDTVTLSNGVVSATLNKAGASVTRLRYQGFDMLSDGYYSMDGGTNYRRPAGCVYRVIKNTPEHVEVAMTRLWKDEPQAFDIEVRYALRAGESGVYTYAVLRHPAKYPQTGYGEWRMVWKLSSDTMEYICVDDKRFLQMQSSKDSFEPTGIKEIIKLTSGIRAGQYDCKYDYAASYYDLGCWGHASDTNRVGAFIVMGSQEFLNDGPTKQDLNAAYGINHIHFGMNHYNGSNPRVAAGETWSKMYGPFLLFVNSGKDARGLWADAKAQVTKERSKWPYAWVDNADWVKPADRGTVTGRLAIVDRLKPSVSAEGAWVGLAAPEAPDGNWQFESKNYQFWAKAEKDGSFTIPAVRPGKYRLYAFHTGAVGEFERRDIEVTRGQTLALGDITWNVPHQGRTIAWEIGTPDRTAKEFRGGDDYFHGYRWAEFDKILPNPLNYDVEKDAGKPPLNYAQCRFGESNEPNIWNIHFKMATLPGAGGEATLTAAIASADRARVDVLVNGEPVGQINPKVQGGNALVRHGIHAKYCVEYVSFPVSKLKAGDNVVSLVFPPNRSPQPHIMYDYLNLELP